VSSGILPNRGHLLENLVFAALRRQGAGLWYHRTRTGKEVDFVARPAGSAPRLVQVCETLADPRTRKREVEALIEALEELDLPAGTLVTRQEEELIEQRGKTVRVLPAWRFALEEG
jgi:predicted AAA+ superfamily ATPase